MSFKEIAECRVCGSRDLKHLLALGPLAQTGNFLTTQDGAGHEVGPLDLVMCEGSDSCGLIQLKQTYSLEQMYGSNYGYRSGLNNSMIAHLFSKVDKIKKMALLNKGDTVLDIGSNDGTTLRGYESGEYKLIGVDPTADKFRQYYRDDISVVADFFPSTSLDQFLKGDRAKVITSFSMFYDLEDPIEFAKNIANVLHEDGIWVFEQSYVFSMLESNSFDTICHEHLEYYGLKQVQRICQQANLKLVDCEFNDVNGGSFSVVAVHAKNSNIPVSNNLKQAIIKEEGYYKEFPNIFEKFLNSVNELPLKFKILRERADSEGVNIYCLGASTKGNVLLQYCGLNNTNIASIGEVNADKYGKYTPGSKIKIVGQEDILTDKNAYFIVLPWHFKKFFESSERFKGLKLVYPLPQFVLAE